jgi:hypothetical protein
MLDEYRAGRELARTTCSLHERPTGSTPSRRSRRTSMTTRTTGTSSGTSGPTPRTSGRTRRTGPSSSTPIAADREHLMDEDERAAWEKLPDTLTIHRGYKLDDGRWACRGRSSYKRACWFARRLVRDGESSQVVTGTIPKAKALAYFTGRNEEEIVAFPDDIRITKTRVLNHRGEGPLGRTRWRRHEGRHRHQGRGLAVDPHGRGHSLKGMQMLCTYCCSRLWHPRQVQRPKRGGRNG